MIVAISVGISRGNGWQWQCPVSALTAGHSGVSSAHARSSDSGGGAGLPGPGTGLSVSGQRSSAADTAVWCGRTLQCCSDMTHGQIMQRDN